MKNDSSPANVLELEALAKRTLSLSAFDYYASGADDEITLRRNREAFERRAVHYRVLVDVSTRTMATSVLGVKLAMPVLVAPTAFHKLACDDGELATARAARGAGTAMMLSSLSNTDLEDVAEEHPDGTFFQLYVYRDRNATVGLVRRAEDAGCKALVLTVDAPLLGRRERDVRNAFSLPPHLKVKNLVPVGYGDVEGSIGISGLAAYFASLIDPALAWSDIAWLRSITKLPIAIKGIVRVDDARRARDEGASAIVVSNHGGRQLDGSPATLDVLAPIADAVGRDVEVLLDGGVRRGTDVLRALALGARAVLVGRPILWGLAWSGETGARFVLDTLRRELDLAMALAGTPTLTAITRDLLEP
ncbi:MAG TPA: alpha-hydroxy acid oxidase [Polyangiaceae bacterium]|jgi:4-hydroxymandelate oxidase